MTKSKSNNIKLGIFVVLAFTLFTYAIYMVGDRQDVFGSPLRIYAHFVDVKGLQEGNNVRYSGITIGSVENIVILNDTTLKVEMSINKSSIQFIKKSAVADIATSGLVGNMLVNISPGRGNQSPIENGDLIHTKEKVEMTDMLNTLSSTNDKIAQITQNILEISEKLNKGQGTLATLINDKSMGKNLIATSQEIKTVSQQLNQTSKQISQLVKGISDGEGNLGYLLKDNSLKHQVGDITQSLDTLINSRTVPIFENLEQASSSIAGTSIKIKAIVEELEHNEGLIGTLLSDSSITNDLQSTMYNLDQGTKKFDESMEALQHHWLLRGFFKKKEKEAKKQKQ